MKRNSLVMFVALSAAQEASGWWVLAYEGELKGRGSSLTREHFDQVIANFKRYGRPVPVTLYHADIDAAAHPDARKAHAWLDELRIGSMSVSGKTVATLEGKRRWVNAGTQADVAAGAIVGGSVTIFFNWKDDATAEKLGAYLYSFSLTNNPALTHLPALAASQGATKQGTALGCIYLPENDVAFVDCMVPHHQMAVAMAQHVAERGSADAVKALASRIITAQTAEIATMRTARREVTGAEDASYPEEYSDDMIEMLARLDGAALDAMFLDAMIPHHASGIVIADAAIPHLARADLREMAKGIVRAQTAEIVEMHVLRTPPAGTPAAMSQRGAAAPTPESTTMSKLIALAALIGVAAKTEDEAATALDERVRENLNVRRALNLTAAAPAGDVAAALSTLSTEAAKVPALTTKLAAFEKREAEALGALRKAHIDDVIAAGALPESVRPSLEHHASADWEGFQKAHPRPSREALAQRSQDPQRLARLSLGAGRAAPAPITGDGEGEPTADDLDQAVRAVMEAEGVDYATALDMLGDVSADA